MRSGHTHNGLVVPGIDNIIKNNIGLIAPNKTFFPKNSRGTIMCKTTKREIPLIISGGIMKLPESSGIFRHFNWIFPMSINKIVITNRKEEKHE